MLLPIPDEERDLKRCSDELIEALQLKDPLVGELIQEALTESGRPTLPLINPELSPDEARAEYAKDARLPAYFHELPGISIIIDAVKNGDMSPEDFKQIFLVSLNHNGPDTGFWGGFTKAVSNLLKQNNSKLIKGTIFEKDGELFYDMPSTPEAVVHVIIDRLDQAIAGIPKLLSECSSWMNLDQVYLNLFGDNQNWTIQQFEALKEWIDTDKFQANIKAKKEGFLKFAHDSIDSAIITIKEFTKYIQQHIRFETLSDKDGQVTGHRLSLKGEGEDLEEVFEQRKNEKAYLHYYVKPEHDSLAHHEFVTRIIAPGAERFINSFLSRSASSTPALTTV